MPDEDDLIDYERCTYCGAEIPADIIRCPKCGQFTDGAGPVQRSGAGWDRRRIIILIVAVAAIAAFLATTFVGC